MFQTSKSKCAFLNNAKNNTPMHEFFFVPNAQYVSIILYKTVKKFLLFLFLISRRLLDIFFFLCPRLWHDFIAALTFRG